MFKSLKLGALALVVAGFGCKSNTETSDPGADPGANPGAAPIAGASGDDPEGNPGAAGEGGGAGASTDPGAPDNRFIGPQISHSRGQAGGVVLLYPRIIPSAIAEENSALASQLQAHVKATIERALPGRPIDVRPKPERVCPQEGCDGMPINVLFSRNGNACLVVALIGQPGPSPIRLMPWAGAVEFKSETVPHREPPENQVVIKDYVPCDALLQAMNDNNSFVEAAIASVAGSLPPATGG